MASRAVRLKGGIEVNYDATGARRDFVQQLTRVDLLVLEDFGMKKLGSNAAEDLRQANVQRSPAAAQDLTRGRLVQRVVRRHS